MLQVAATLGERVLGEFGFYAVSIVAGLVSSASGVAAHGTISFPEAGLGVVLNSFASTAIKVPLVARISGDRLLTARVALALGLVMLVGVVGTFVPLAPLQTLAAAR